MNDKCPEHNLESINSLFYGKYNTRSLIDYENNLDFYILKKKELDFRKF